VVYTHEKWIVEYEIPSLSTPCSARVPQRSALKMGLAAVSNLAAYSSLYCTVLYCTVLVTGWYCNVRILKDCRDESRICNIENTLDMDQISTSQPCRQTLGKVVSLPTSHGCSCGDRERHCGQRAWQSWPAQPCHSRSIARKGLSDRPITNRQTAVSFSFVDAHDR
jgi:hypothetical protein